MTKLILEEKEDSVDLNHESNERESKENHEQTQEKESTSFAFVLTHEESKTAEHADQQTHSNQERKLR